MTNKICRLTLHFGLEQWGHVQRREHRGGLQVQKSLPLASHSSGAHLKFQTIVTSFSQAPESLFDSFLVVSFLRSCPPSMPSEGHFWVFFTSKVANLPLKTEQHW